MAEPIKISFATLNPGSGNGNQTVTVTGDAHTGRVQRTVTVEVGTTGGEVKKQVVINQAAALEAVTIDNTATVAKAGGSVTINGTSNSTTLTFELTQDGTNPLVLPAVTSYTAAGAAAESGVAIPDDPGAGATYNFSVTFNDIPENTTVNELITTLKVTAAGGQSANCVITQTEGDPRLEVTPETINLTAEGTADNDITIVSNTDWTIAQAVGRMMAKMLGKK